jgi:hypothetical protein
MDHREHLLQDAECGVDFRCPLEPLLVEKLGEGAKMEPKSQMKHW